jgi:class 3 adenylate cyclase
VEPLPLASSQLPQQSEAQQEHQDIHLPQDDTPVAEHRSLTVLCAELVNVACRADHGDAEALHTLVQAFHATCTEVIHAFEGSIAHYLSDGVVAYFGYPQAHEDDVQRSIRAGLRLVDVLQQRPPTAAQGPGTVRIGIHTGPVVVGESRGDGRAPLAVGETLSVAVRLKELAAPGRVVVSATTARLVEGYFRWQAKAVPPLPGEH